MLLNMASCVYRREACVSRVLRECEPQLLLSLNSAASHVLDTLWVIYFIGSLLLGSGGGSSSQRGLQVAPGREAMAPGQEAAATAARRRPSPGRASTGAAEEAAVVVASGRRRWHWVEGTAAACRPPREASAETQGCRASGG